MKIYLVGGAVRDALLGLPVKEKDWVVVGSTPAEMQSLNFRQVGKEFPVFLHPTTKEEYALARMERKVGLGYSGFTFDTSANVTLEEDLARRDLTINAMAKSADGEIIDPYHGQNDLEQKLLRHVSPAFSEDPVRILRLGRFLARFAPLGFSIAPETISLMQEMVQKGEVNALVAERVWKEWVRALSEAEPVQFFIALNKAKALPILFPDFANDERGLVALDEAARLTHDATVRFAALCYAYPDSISSICARYRAPHPFRDLALLTAKHYQGALQAYDLSADALVNLFSSLDVFRRKNRFEQFLLAVTAIQRAISPDHPFDATWLAQAAEVTCQYDVQSLIAQGLSGQALAEKLREERVKKLAKWSQT